MASCALDDRKLRTSAIGSGVGLDAGGENGGVSRLEVSPAVIDLGWVATGFAARGRLSVRNAGTAPLRPPSVGWAPGSSPDFVVLRDQCVGGDVAPGQSCDVRLQVVPSQAGALQGTLEVKAGTGGAKVAVAALGIQAGDLILAPAMGSFDDYGGVLVGSASELLQTAERREMLPAGRAVPGWLLSS